MALGWTLSSLSMCISYWGAQHWTQCSRHGLTSAGQRGRITFLPLPFLEARAVKLGVHQDNQAFSTKMFSSWVASSTCWCLALSLPRRKFALFLIELHEVPVGRFLHHFEVPVDLRLWDSLFYLLIKEELGEPLSLEPPSYRITAVWKISAETTYCQQSPECFAVFAI